MSAFEKRHRLAQLALLTALFALPGFILLRTSQAGDADLWWHLRTGQWILAHRAVPQTDPFSAYGAGKPWAAYSWLFEILIYGLYWKWRIAGTVVYTAGMLTAIAASLYGALRRQSADFVLTAVLAIVCLDALSPLFTPRPWLFTLLIYIYEIAILMDARATGRRRGLYFLPLLFAVWANIHIEFVVGLLILGLAAAEPLAERWWPQKHTHLRSSTLWPIFAACVLATFINPYGWRIYSIAYQLADMPAAANLISEMSALSFRAYTDFVLLFLTLFCVAALAWNRRAAFFEVATLAFAIVVTFRTQRELYLLAVFAVVLLASVLPAADQAPGAPSTLSLPGIAAASGLLVWIIAICLHIDNARYDNDLAQHMPVRAVVAIKAGHYRGPLFNTYDWGGYLIWDLRLPVSVDGRAAIYGDSFLMRNASTWNAGPNWRTDPELASAGIVLGAVDLPLTQVLRLDPRFKLIYEDKLAAIFVQKKLQGMADSTASCPSR